MAQTMTPGMAPELLAHGFDISIAPSLNFVNAGTQIALIGTPCVGPQMRRYFLRAPRRHLLRADEGAADTGLTTLALCGGPGERARRLSNPTRSSRLK